MTVSKHRKTTRSVSVDDEGPESKRYKLMQRIAPVMIPKKKKVIPNGKKTNADLKQAAFRIYIDQVWNIIGRMPFDLESLNKEQSMARFKALDHFESNRIGNMKKWRNPQKELEKKIIHVYRKLLVLNDKKKFQIRIQNSVTYGISRFYLAIMDISCGDDKPYITDQELDKNHRLACEETLKFFENSKKDCVEYWHEVLENVLDNLAAYYQVYAQKNSAKKQ